MKRSTVSLFTAAALSGCVGMPTKAQSSANEDVVRIGNGALINIITAAAGEPVRNKVTASVNAGAAGAEKLNDANQRSPLCENGKALNLFLISIFKDSSNAPTVTAVPYAPKQGAVVTSQIQLASAKSAEASALITRAAGTLSAIEKRQIAPSAEAILGASQIITVPDAACLPASGPAVPSLRQ